MDKTISFIRTNSFGQLVSLVEGRLFASHLPFMIADDGSTMLCHLARQNPQWEHIEAQEVLISFQGPHDYISPGWYTSPGVPTWNYQVVHVYGNCSPIHSPDELKAIVERLTQNYESKFQNPWVPKYSEALLKNIVGLEVSVNEIQCKFKLNQNRSEQDRARVTATLDEYGSGKLATAMRENKK